MIEKLRLKDIAEEAGVSISTVCRAIRDPGSVKASSLSKVNDALTALGYHISGEDGGGAKKNGSLLCILPDSTSMFYSDIINGIQSAADYNGYNIFFRIGASLDMSFEEILKICQDVNAKGVIILHGTHNPNVMVELDKVIPVVQCCGTAPDVNISSVSIDDYACGKKITSYLLSIGKKRIAMIGVGGYSFGILRERGYRDVLELNGIDVDERLVVHLNEITYEESYIAAFNLLSMDYRPDAIFAVSDTVASAVCAAARRLGLRVPKDLSVVGVDNTIYSQISIPSITTVNQPRLQMGTLVCEILINEMNNPGAAKTKIEQDFDLIIRDST